MSRRNKLLLPLWATALSGALFLGLRPAGAVPVPEDLKGELSYVKRASDRQLRALVENQVEAVELMVVHFWLTHDRRFPKSFDELTRSPSWFIEVYNLFSGKPIEDVSFFPSEGDMVPPDQFPLTSLQPGSSSVPSPVQSQELELRPVIPTRIPLVRGDLFYFTDGESFAQLTIRWGKEDDQLINRVITRPYNYFLAFDPLLLPPVTQSDDALFRVALFLERMLAEFYQRYAYFFDRPAMSPQEVRNQGPEYLLSLARELGFVPYNPFTDEALEVSSSYQAGTIYKGPLTEEFPKEIFYCFSNGRIRSIAELSDQRVRKARKSSIDRRDQMARGVKQVAPYPPPKAGEDKTPPSRRDKPWRKR